MEDQSSRQTDKENPSQKPATGGHSVNPQPATPPVAAPGVVNTGDSAIHGAQRDSGVNQPPQPQPAQLPVAVNVLPQPAQSDKTMNWLTAIIAAATIANVLIFWLESEDTAKHIRELSTKAGEIVGSMNTALSDSRDAVSKAFSVNKAAVDASNLQNQRSLRATLKSAADTNELTKKSLEIQERPWVGATSINVAEDIAVGRTLSATMSFQNSGKSPAVHVETKFRMNTVCGGFPKRPDYGTLPPGSRSILMPGAPPVQSGESRGLIPLDQIVIDALKPTTGCNLYAFGKIAYDDTFGKSHWRHVCAEWQYGTPRALSSCGSYNDGDEDYPDGKEPE